jgi:homoserine dehydrogenase
VTSEFRVGLLGHGTVGGAFARLLEERADGIAAATGRSAVLAGVLTRRDGDFEAILEGSDAIVELMGGLDPARDLVVRALQAGRHVVTANKQLLSQHGDELWAAAAETGAQLRFEAAVAGVVPVVRVLAESLAGAHVERVHGIVNGTTNYILTEMARTGASYEEALAQAQRLGYAEPDPSEDVDGRDAAAKMAILARLAFGGSVHLDQVPYEGIEHIAPADLEYADEFGLGLKLLGTAERVDGGLSVRVHPVFLYPGHPLASVTGPFNAVTVESEAITEMTAQNGPRQLVADLEIVPDVSSAFYLHLEVADEPGVLAQVAQILGLQGASIKSVVQKGLGNDARLVMIMHPVLESKFFAAVELISGLDFIRAAPRAIRVIEEEFV